MSHRLSFACQMGDMLHALICRTDHDDSWKKAWGVVFTRHEHVQNLQMSAIFTFRDSQIIPVAISPHLLF